MRRAFITGITGQDGSYLAELLLNKGYEVHGLIRRSSSINTDRIDHLYQDPQVHDRRLFLHYGDLTDGSNLYRLLHQKQPDEIYNLGAQSHVKVSFDCPEYTVDADALGTVRLLEAFHGACPSARFYQASSSEMYGGLDCPFPGGYDESHAFHPRSPYGCAKVFSHHLTVNYRESYRLHASCGILFNHESPRRGETFVTRKIAKAAARIAAGMQDKLYLGNLDARRDWGHAKDYIKAMWMMLQQDEPDDYVIATGLDWSVRDFLDRCFNYVGLDYHKFVVIDPRYYRPAEVPQLVGNSHKAREVLGWDPEYDIDDLVADMMNHELALTKEQERGLHKEE
jgi:GDPmannose 4,6-dehydratase